MNKFFTKTNLKLCFIKITSNILPEPDGTSSSASPETVSKTWSQTVFPASRSKSINFQVVHDVLNFQITVLLVNDQVFTQSSQQISALQSKNVFNRLDFRGTNDYWRDFFFFFSFFFDFLYIFRDFPSVTLVHSSFEAQASANLKFTHMSTNQVRVVKEDFLINKSVLGRNFSDFTLAQFRLVVIVTFQMRNFVSFGNLHHLKMSEVFLGFHRLDSSNVFSQ